MTRTYRCYHDAIKSIIPAGESNKITLSQLISHERFEIKREHQNSSDFKKVVTREVRYLIKTIGKTHNHTQDKLVEEITGPGKPNYFYWSSIEAKNKELHKEDISEDRYYARAMIFSFVDDHFRDFFPPEVMERLQEDVNSARDEFYEPNSISEKLSFIPTGVDVSTAYDISERNTDDRNLAFNALKNELVFKTNYQSLHSTKIQTLHLSPQLVQYANHKVVLLCYVHETGKVKPFEIARLNNVQVSSAYKFKSVDFSEIQNDYAFEAVVNEGVKNYFTSILFGKEFCTKKLEDGTWLIKATISIPDHFSEAKQGKPDPFNMANFLMTFSDSMKVLKPDFLKNEMKRRSLNLAKLYSDSEETAELLKKSPHEQTGNLYIVESPVNKN